MSGLYPIINLRLSSHDLDMNIAWYSLHSACVVSVMEVGNLESFEADEAHFGLWVVTSSPLILGSTTFLDTALRPYLSEH